jgi:hypothetical protein
LKVPKMKITELEKEDKESWDSYVHKSHTSTFYHQIGWKNVVEKTYKHKHAFWQEAGFGSGIGYDDKKLPYYR